MPMKWFLISLISLIGIIIVIIGGAQMIQAAKSETVLESPLGLMGWYPNDPTALRQMFDGYVKNTHPQPEPQLRALILPHAGYAYSGQIAMYGIAQLKGAKIKQIIILGPSHRAYINNQAVLPDATHIQTPLGKIAVNTRMVAALKKYTEFIMQSKVQQEEHSAQIEIPMIQYARPDVSVVPIILGNLDSGAAKRIANRLLSVIDNETLVIVSSDFTHYGARFDYLPFKTQIKENLEKLDMGACDQIKNLDADGFRRYCDNTGATICGRMPIEVMLNMIKPGSVVKQLAYTTSGALTSDWDNSVSYVTLMITGDWQQAKKALESEGMNMTLNDSDKKALLSLARGTVDYYLKNRQRPTPQALGITITDPMKAVMGAFVTLKKNHDLRGCIGEIIPRRPLYEAVMDQAINAAVNDNRFSPVTANEVKDLEFEISALTAPYEVPSYRDIVLGKHGIIIEKMGRSAVFLPQVAPEQGWTIQETLSHLSMKAGLSANAWQDGTRFYVFEAIVFSEHALK